MQLKSVDFAGSAAKPNQLLKRPVPHFVFAGKSNVGKSSLLNKLLNRKRLAYVSKTPGKTRLINYFLINDRFFFVDLPGYGYANVSKVEQQRWGRLIETYLSQSPFIALIFLLMDLRHEPGAHDRQMLEWLNHFQVNYKIILTKADKLSRGQCERRRNAIAKSFNLTTDDLIITSSAKGLGIQEIWRSIEGLLTVATDKINNRKESTPC